MEGKDDDSKECIFCKVTSTLLLAGTSVYLGILARQRPQHRLFLGVGSLGMAVFAGVNWVLRQSTVEKPIEK